MHRGLAVLITLAGCGFEVRVQGASGSDADTGQPDGGPVRADAGLDAIVVIPDAPIDAPPEVPPDAPPAPQPVRVDLPSVADTYLSSDLPNYNGNNEDTMLVDGSPRRTVVLRFDLSSVPAEATVSSAVLYIATAYDPGQTVTVHRMLQGWSESAATWNQRSTGLTWANAGAGAPDSRSATAIGALTPSQANRWYAVSLDAATVQSWVANPAQNHGLALVTTSSDGTRFRTREFPAQYSGRPFLRVSYLP